MNLIGPDWNFRNWAFVLAMTGVNVAAWLYVAPVAIRKARNWHMDASTRRMDATAPSWQSEQGDGEGAAEGLAKVEQDALTLLRYHHRHGRRMTRRQAQRRGWTQDTWNKCYGAAKSAGCYDDNDELVVDLNDWDTVLDMVHEWRMTQAELNRLGNFISAR